MAGMWLYGMCIYSWYMEFGMLAPAEYANLGLRRGGPFSKRFPLNGGWRATMTLKSWYMVYPPLEVSLPGTTIVHPQGES